MISVEYIENMFQKENKTSFYVFKELLNIYPSGKLISKEDAKSLNLNYSFLPAEVEIANESLCEDLLELGLILIRNNKFYTYHPYSYSFNEKKYSYTITTKRVVKSLAYDEFNYGDMKMYSSEFIKFPHASSKSDDRVCIDIFDYVVLYTVRSNTKSQYCAILNKLKILKKNKSNIIKRYIRNINNVEGASVKMAKQFVMEASERELDNFLLTKDHLDERAKNVKLATSDIQTNKFQNDVVNYSASIINPYISLTSRSLSDIIFGQKLNHSAIYYSLTKMSKIGLISMIKRCVYVGEYDYKTNEKHFYKKLAEVNNLRGTKFVSEREGDKVKVYINLTNFVELIHDTKFTESYYKSLERNFNVSMRRIPMTYALSEKIRNAYDETLKEFFLDVTKNSDFVGSFFTELFIAYSKGGDNAAVRKDRENFKAPQKIVYALNKEIKKRFLVKYINAVSSTYKVLESRNNYDSNVLYEEYMNTLCFNKRVENFKGNEFMLSVYDTFTEQYSFLFDMESSRILLKKSLDELNNYYSQVDFKKLAELGRIPTIKNASYDYIASGVVGSLKYVISEDLTANTNLRIAPIQELIFQRFAINSYKNLIKYGNCYHNKAKKNYKYKRTVAYDNTVENNTNSVEFAIYKNFNAPYLIRLLQGSASTNAKLHPSFSWKDLVDDHRRDKRIVKLSSLSDSEINQIVNRDYTQLKV